MPKTKDIGMVFHLSTSRKHSQKILPKYCHNICYLHFRERAGDTVNFFFFFLGCLVWIVTSHFLPDLLSDYAVLDSFSPKEMMNLVLRDHEGDHFDSDFSLVYLFCRRFVSAWSICIYLIYGLFFGRSFRNSSLVYCYFLPVSQFLQTIHLPLS